MTPFLLSIVIPTYNRVAQLELLLEDVSAVLAVHGETVQVVVSDNHSTDATPAVIMAFAARWPNSVKPVTRQVNIGMEGNIACAMLEGDGKYIWTVSDHQRLCIPEVLKVAALVATTEFDVAHARVRQWSAILDRCDQVINWRDIPLEHRGALFFSLGNLSTLMLRRELVLASAKSIFQSCVWSYPHLGFIPRIEDITRFIEFDSLSAFPEMKDKPKLKLDYDKLSVSFRAHRICVDTLSARGHIRFSHQGFFTREYRAAFRSDVVNYLLRLDVSKRQALKALTPLVPANPWKLRFIAIGVLTGFIVLPRAVRIRLASTVKSWFVRPPVQSEAGG